MKSIRSTEKKFLLILHRDSFSLGRTTGFLVLMSPGIVVGALGLPDGRIAGLPGQGPCDSRFRITSN
jgi:hypothetical protein